MRYHYGEYGMMPVAQHHTWGTASHPETAAKQLLLDRYLPEVPENGTVVDIGAGIGLSLGAAIHVKRPDLRITAIDPGFSLPESEEAFETDLRITLKSLILKIGQSFNLALSGIVRE